MAVADVLADFGRFARQAINSASDAGDQDTTDIFTEISRGVDKWLWFVEAHLQAGAWAHTRAGREGEAESHAGH